MVILRLILTIALSFITTMPILAQSSFNDTVAEHPMKGTIYHNRFEGRKTASGEIFNQNLFTAAHRRIKMGTLVMVTSKKTGQQVIVKINDRCPKSGVLDMTRRAANSIGIRGCQPVTVRILPDSYEKLWATQDLWCDSVYSRLSEQEKKP